MLKARFFRSWFIYFLLAFPLFYFVYKHGTADYGLKDFYSYYELYKNWDIDKIESPFNMRLVSSFFVYLFYKAGLHYDTLTAFDKTGLSREVFFCSVFFNYLCVVSTCSVLFHTILKIEKRILLAFAGGMIYLLGFGTLFYEIMPITDAFSVLIFTLILDAYLSKKYSIFIFMAILIVQREYVFLALGLLSLLDFWKFRNKYYLHVLLSTVLCFGIYYVLRKTIFYTPKYDYQASTGYFLKVFTELRFPLLPYFKQTFITLNLFIIYLLVLGWKKFRKLSIDKFALVKILLLFLQINFISFAAAFGNNTGRYFYILVPLIIIELVKESAPLLKEDASALT